MYTFTPMFVATWNLEPLHVCTHMETWNQTQSWFYRYVFHVVDHASKLCWVFPMATQQSSLLLSCLRTVNTDSLPSLGITPRLWNSDGSAELIASYLHCADGTTSTSQGTRPRYSVTELWMRSLKEKVMCMLFVNYYSIITRVFRGVCCGSVKTFCIM